MRDAYAMTDGVSDEQFDEAIADAKTEGNVSRQNVVPNVTVAPVSRPRNPGGISGGKP